MEGGCRCRYRRDNSCVTYPFASTPSKRETFGSLLTSMSLSGEYVEFSFQEVVNGGLDLSMLWRTRRGEEWRDERGCLFEHVSLEALSLPTLPLTLPLPTNA